MVDFERKLSRRAFTSAALMASAAAGLFAACGGGSEAPAQSTQSTGGGQAAPTKASGSGASTAAATSSTTTAPPAKQTPVVIAQSTEQPTLDPMFAESGSLANILFTIFDGLIAYSKEMEIVGEAAASWEVQPDSKTWQFKLKKGIKFWNGEPLDANAVKFTFDRSGNADLRKQGLNDPYYGRVGFDHAEVVDDSTVNLVLKKPNVNFLVYTTFVMMLAPKYYGEHTPQQTAIAPMGSGPWKFKEWVKDDHLTLEANPDYFLGKPPIETVIFKPVTEGSTRMAMLERGEADIITEASPEDVARMKGMNNVHAGITNDNRRVHIELPTEHKLFSDRRVRLAMNYAVNFDAINQAILGGLAPGRMAVPLNGDFWIDPSIKPYPYDPDKAKSLLKEAGWDANAEITIYAPVGTYVKGEELAQAVAGDWRKVGMKAQAQTLEGSVFNTKARASQFDMPWLAGWGSRHFGPDDLSVLFEGGFQGFEWVDNTEGGPKAKTMMEELKVTVDPKRQQELSYQISRIFVDEAPWVFLWKQVGLFGVSNRLDWEPKGKARAELWYAGGKPSTIKS